MKWIRWVATVRTFLFEMLDINTISKIKISFLFLNTMFMYLIYIFYTQIKKIKYLTLIIKVKINLLPETKITIKHAESIV